jgi:hypothetical protein
MSRTIKMCAILYRFNRECLIGYLCAHVPTYPRVYGVEDFMSCHGMVGVDNFRPFFLEDGDDLVKLDRPLSATYEKHLHA